MKSPHIFLVIQVFLILGLLSFSIYKAQHKLPGTPTILTDREQNELEEVIKRSDSLEDTSIYLIHLHIGDFDPKDCDVYRNTYKTIKNFH